MIQLSNDEVKLLLELKNYQHYYFEYEKQTFTYYAYLLILLYTLYTYQQHACIKSYLNLELN